MSSEAANKPKLQLRSVVSFNGDKTPSPATKLLINHGKPNFTISRTATKQNGGSDEIKSLSPQGDYYNNNNNNNNNNGTEYNNYNNDNNDNTLDSKTHNYNPYKSSNSFYNNANNNNNNNNNNNIINNGTLKSTKFNGTLRPVTLPVNNNSNSTTSSSSTTTTTTYENEASKVVLRRTKITETTSSGASSIADGDDEASVPEFIRRQRRIQERLAKENVLDFENRRSGYFTHVIVSPTSTTTNRTSFAETMSSPAVNPALEMPTATATTTTMQQQQQQQQHEATHYEHVEHESHESHESHEIEINEISTIKTTQTTTTKSSNGHHFEEVEEEEEEVAKAIEEVNKAVAQHELSTVNGDEHHHHHHQHHNEQQEHELMQPRTLEFVMETKEQPPVYEIQAAHPAEHFHTTTITAAAHEETKEDIVHATVAVATLEHVEHMGNMEQVKTTTTSTTTTAKPVENGHSSVVETTTTTTTTTEKIEGQQQNGHNGITISHTNGFDGPCIPAPDPSGALGVNYEPKTVVSFSKDLATEVNKYPDTVRDVDGEPVAVTVNVEDERLKELAKLKFDIKADDEDVKVIPVLRTEVEQK